MICVDGYKNDNDLNDEYYKILNWYKSMWLSNIDLFRLIETCIDAKIDGNKNFTILNGVSNNKDSRWLLNNEIGYQPMYDVYDFNETQKIEKK